MKILTMLLKFILKLIKFVVKEIVSFGIKFTLLIIVGLVIVGLVMKYNKAPKPVIKEGTIVEIDFSDDYSDKISAISKLVSGEKEDFYGLLYKLDEIKNDSKVSGVIFKLDNLTFDNGEIEEIGTKIESLKKHNKKTYMYATNFNNKNYSLALYGDEIIMPPTMAAGVNLIGYYSELAYYGGLASRLGVKFNVIHVGDYKAYGENFVRKNMSKEYKENITKMKDIIYGNFVDSISNFRKKDREVINTQLLEGKFASSNPVILKENGLIDELKYEYQLKEELGEDKILSLGEYSESLVKKEKKDKIAVIYVNGAIMMDDQEQRGLSQMVTPESIFSEIDKIIDEDEIKGVVLRINSPGGSALASNIITKRFEYLKTKKPLYVSIGGIAASGGYYIATSGEKIFADRESITGSIGVVSIIPNFEKLIKEIDVNIETIKKGEYSDLYSVTTNFTEKDREKIYDSSYTVYDEFLTVVANSRKMSKEDVNKIGQGRVWLGSQAKEIGLIDDIGGLEYTIEALAKELKLENYSVVEMVEAPKLSDVLKGMFPFLVTAEKLNNVVNGQKELYFKPLYYLPYNLN